MLKTILPLFAILVLVLAPAAAQQVPPYTYPITLGTSSVSILPANPARKKLYFHNPNDSAKVAVCPVGPTSRGAGIARTDRCCHQRRRLRHASPV